MDVIHDSFVETYGFDFYGSPTTGVNSIDTKFIIVTLNGGIIENSYDGSVIIQNNYYTS